jgi:hypothetical protein
MLAIKVPKLEFLCEIFGPISSWYHEIFTYLHRGIFPFDLTPKL